MRKITSTKYLIDKDDQTKKFFSKEIRIENEEGLLYKLKKLNIKNEVRVEFENFYDDNGELKKYTQYHPEIKYTKIWEIERDKQNRIAKINFRTSENHPEFNYGETFYQYSSNGKIIEITERMLGEEPSRSTRHIDHNGKILRHIEFDEDMEIVYELRCSYYSNGQTKEINYWGRGAETLETRSFYNQNGEIIKKEYYEPDKTIETFIYKYDFNGLWIERKTFENDQIKFLEERIIVEKVNL